MNNACQTVRRPAAYYAPQVAREESLAREARDRGFEPSHLLLHRAFEATHQNMLETGSQGATSLAPTGDVSMHPEALVPARLRGGGELRGGVGVMASSAKMAKVRPRPGVFAIMPVQSVDAAACDAHILSCSAALPFSDCVDG